jgi:hypothetical protein
MSRLRLVKSVAILCVLALALTGAATAGAATSGPGWSITSLPEPTVFQAADGHGEVVDLAVAATGGTYEMISAMFGEARPTPALAWNATAPEVQAALETLPGVTAALVHVSGGPGDHTASTPYKVAWAGSSPVGLLFTIEDKLTNTDSEGNPVEGTAEITSGAHVSALDRYAVTVVNTGSKPFEGEPIVVRDELPAQVIAAEAKITEPATTQVGECVLGATIECSYSEPLRPGAQLVMTVNVISTSSVAERLENHATVSSSGHKAEVDSTNEINVAPLSFGIAAFGFGVTGVDGGTEERAGAHPYAVTTTINLNTILDPSGLQPYTVPQELKTVAVDLPLGFIGNPMAAPQCPPVDLTDGEGTVGGNNGFHTRCPENTQIGKVRTVWSGGERSPQSYPLYNLEPEPGYPAEFGFNAGISQPIYLYASVLPGTDGYRVEVATPGVLRTKLDIEGVSVTVFGDPGEHNHSGEPTAFLTNPSRCGAGPLKAGVEVTSWEGSRATAETTAYAGVTGCNLLQQGVASFSPSLSVQPTTLLADAPTGLDVKLHIPQAPDAFSALSTPNLRDAQVTLPPGMSLSPAAASGPEALLGCTDAQIDLFGVERGEGHPGGNGSPYDDSLEHATPGHCPERSQIGTVKIKSPILSVPLEGHVYVAQPSCGGAGQPACTEQAAENGEVFGIYLEAAGAGVIVKLPGHVEVGGHGAHSSETGLQPGQIRANFDDDPQFPAEDVEMHLDAGERAALATSQTCGEATTTSELTPWSAPESGPLATPSSSFTIVGCASTPSLAPGFQAGTLTTGAGGFSPFTMTLSRNDRESDISTVEVHTPPGLLGYLSHVQLCQEPDAARGTCSPSSLIGHVSVAAGSGTQPLWQHGQVFLTSGYGGGEFGLSIVTPAVAGPFNLGDVVVRAAIHVDPHTAALTVDSAPLPQFVDGVPLRIKTINVTIDKPEFTFNPTNCSAQQVTATVGAVGAPAVVVTSPFAATGCKNLPFRPSFTVSTQGKTSKASGASLTVKVAQKPGEANIRKVQLQLPKILPARLTTLQKACTEAQFNANPAGCPAASVIGTAKAVTPVLNVPLTGPAYLVSHGGAAFPDVEFLLQGEGVQITLDGKTDIKKGITYSRFETVPDAPISSFETVLPEGSHSALAANGNLCATTRTVGVRRRTTVRVHGRKKHIVRTVKRTVSQSLVIPTTIVGQNGAQIVRSTRVAVTGCVKAKPKKKAGKKVRGK